MARAGILKPEWRTELLDGEVVIMSPIGSPHAAAVTRTDRFFQRALGDRAIVVAQNPVELSRHSEPQPDITLAHPKDDFYESGHPTPEETFLVIEVADTSYSRDVKKLRLYAQQGVPEVWIGDLNRGVLRVSRSPRGDRYAETLELSRGESLAPLAFPDVLVRVEDILGPGLEGRRRTRKTKPSA
jgi:Uma2 family endonuclease